MYHLALGAVAKRACGLHLETCSVPFEGMIAIVDLRAYWNRIVVEVSIVHLDLGAQFLYDGMDL